MVTQTFQSRHQAVVAGALAARAATPASSSSGGGSTSRKRPRQPDADKADNASFSARAAAVAGSQLGPSDLRSSLLGTAPADRIRAALGSSNGSGASASAASVGAAGASVTAGQRGHESPEEDDNYDSD